jgi:hypothetical protein
MALISAVSGVRRNMWTLVNFDHYSTSGRPSTRLSGVCCLLLKTSTIPSHWISNCAIFTWPLVVVGSVGRRYVALRIDVGTSLDEELQDFNSTSLDANTPVNEKLNVFIEKPWPGPSHGWQLWPGLGIEEAKAASGQGQAKAGAPGLQA